MTWYVNTSDSIGSIYKYNLIICICVYIHIHIGSGRTLAINRMDHNTYQQSSRYRAGHQQGTRPKTRAHGKTRIESMIRPYLGVMGWGPTRTTSHPSLQGLLVLTKCRNLVTKPLFSNGALKKDRVLLGIQHQGFIDQPSFYIIQWILGFVRG